ncbi:hypothetical protein SUGI_1052950 [Cryptomeria japonica]|nr:hypothetical protein SUGI_1052950 [Cryptomeria japonica]
MLLPKAGAFLWITLHNRILTGDKLKMIGISGSNMCVMCRADEETANHLLFNCPLAEACWNWFFDKTNLKTIRSEILKDFLISWPSTLSLRWSSLWLVGPSMIVWHIWKERNMRIFKEAPLPVDKIIDNIKSAVEEVINGKIAKRKIRNYNDWDRRMEKFWLLKDPRPIVTSTKAKIDRENIRWKAPPMDWMKLNFDGASKGNPRDSSFGAIIRNNIGDPIYGVYGGLGFATNNETKIRALEAGLNLCVQIGISRVIIEENSQIIINNIIKSNFQCWKLRKWLPRINYLLEKIGTFEINHEYREGNQTTDYLANLGVVNRDGMITFDRHSASEDIINQIKQDSSHEVILPLVDIIDSREWSVELLNDFVKSFNGNSVANAILNLEEEGQGMKGREGCGKGANEDIRGERLGGILVRGSEWKHGPIQETNKLRGMVVLRHFHRDRHHSG